jgi:hypothetical protein
VKKLNNFKWFTLGMLVCLLAMTLIVPAFATSLTKTAQLVYNDINITMNGNAITPKDADGNTVEPFTIDGTTYLPVRAISNALGLSVGWDGNTKTVQLTNAQSSPSGKVIYENGGVKITYLGISAMNSSMGGEEIKLYIENSSAKNYIVQIRDVSINGIMANPLFSCTVTAGKSAYDSIEFYNYELEDCNVTTISTAEFTFLIADADNLSSHTDSDVITVNK